MLYRHALTAILAFAACSAAHAKTNISIAYQQPSGVVGNTDSIEMWVTVSSDRTIDTALGAPFGFDASELPTQAWRYDGQTSTWVTETFASYTSLSVGYGYTCIPTCDSFRLTGGASSGANKSNGYRFIPAFANTVQDQGYNLINNTSTSLQTGTFLVGTFIPESGIATPGTYKLLLSPVMQLGVRGVSATGEELVASIGSHDVFEACMGYRGCEFTRIVVSVPEASTSAMAAAGLLCLIATARRQRSISKNER